MEKAVTIKGVLDKRYQKKAAGTYHLAIRITYDRKPVIFPLDEQVTEEDFKKLGSPRLGEVLAKIKVVWLDAHSRAHSIVKEMGTFTFLAFQERFYKDSPDRQKRGRLKLRWIANSQGCLPADLPPTASTLEGTIPPEGKNRKYGKRKFDRIRSNVDFARMGPLAVLYGEYIKTLEAQARIGTSEAYFCSLISLLKYRPCLRMEDITVNFLYAYEQWMLADGNSESTVGIYLRPLRAILNIQKSAGLLLEKDYPFGLRKYLIPAGVNNKIALTQAELRLLWRYQYQTTNPEGLFYLAIWFFGFFANGINPKDIINLRYSNFQGDFIIIQRQKTRRTTRRKPKKITIPINEPMRRIMRRFGNSDTAPKNYVFDILKPGLSPHRQRELNQDFTCTIIDWMNKIAAEVGIAKRITTKVWRHSFATMLKRSGISTVFISEALGHHDLQTTEDYLDEFELDVKAQVTLQLTEMIEGTTVGSDVGF
jgi:integrase/recombinase XerD